MSKLDALKAAFGKAKESTNDDLYAETYPFWMMKDNEQAIIRFLPDGDDQNPLAFLAEKLMHKLNINGKRRSVPCLKMYGESDCPICAISADYYKNEDKVNGKKYWRNKQHIARAIIVEDPLPVEDGKESHVGQIRTINLSYQIYESINQAFQSGELDDVPFDFENGCDFIIKKKVTKEGDKEYASYVYSTFSRRSTPISKYIDESTIVLAELSSFLPENPGREKLEEYLQADITGSAVGESSGAKPSTSSVGDQLAALKAKTAKTTEEVVTPKATPKATPSDDDVDSEADAILASILSGRS